MPTTPDNDPEDIEHAFASPQGRPSADCASVKALTTHGNDTLPRLDLPIFPLSRYVRVAGGLRGA